MKQSDFIYCPESGNLFRKKNKEPRKPIGGVQMCGRDGKKPYKKAMVDGKTYYLHRLVWWFHNGRWPKNEIDHINGDGTDNRIENLREVTRSENMRNVKKRSTNTSGHYGVSWNNKNKRWHSVIKVNGESIFLGAYKEKSDAIRERKKAEKLHGFHDQHGENLECKL